MGLRRKEMHLRQKARFEQELKDRMSLLAGKGIKPPKADRDTLIRKLKANIRAINYRLNLIAANEKRTEEMAKIKVERAAARLKEQEGGKAEKPKKAPEVVKEKKIKPEKKAAPPKAPEDGQSQTPTPPSEGGKASAEK
jgi:hypothetical protein